MPSLMALRLKKLKMLLTAALHHTETVSGKGASSKKDHLCHSHKEHGLVDMVHTRSKKRRCEKCRRKSDTCHPNQSFISGKKHYLCQDCRAASDKMKDVIYTQFFQQNGPPRIGKVSQCNADLAMEPTPPARTETVESGYETSDSCSLSPHSQQAWDNAAQACGQHHSAVLLTNIVPSHSHKNTPDNSQEAVHIERKKKMFENTHTKQLHIHSKHERGYSKLDKKHLHLLNEEAATLPLKYDGYLDYVPPTALKYTLEPPSKINDCVHVNNRISQNDPCPVKVCAVCKQVKDTAFRFPSSTRWLCEDCMDVMS